MHTAARPAAGPAHPSAAAAASGAPPTARCTCDRNLPIREARPFRGVGGQFLDRHVERNIGQHQISAWIVPSRTPRPIRL